MRKSYKAEVEEFEKSEAFSQMVARVSRMAGLQLDNEEAGQPGVGRAYSRDSKGHFFAKVFAKKGHI